MAKSNIKVSRYLDTELPEGAACADGSFAWEMSIEPDDGSWVMFVPKDKTQEPQLWICVGKVDHGDGQGEENAYAPVGSEEHKAYLEAMPSATVAG